MNEASVMMVGINEKKIISAINILKKDNVKLKMVDDYNVTNFSSKIPRLIISYLNSVEKMEIINFLKINSKNLALKFIVFSFPLALVSGPLIPDLIISLSSLFFLIFFYKEFLI